MARLLRHRQTKGAATDRLGLRDAESCFLLYPIIYTRRWSLGIHLHIPHACFELPTLTKGGRGDFRMVTIRGEFRRSSTPTWSFPTFVVGHPSSFSQPIETGENRKETPPPIPHGLGKGNRERKKIPGANKARPYRCPISRPDSRK